MRKRRLFRLFRGSVCKLVLGLALALLQTREGRAKSGQTFYEEGLFEEALEQFISEQVERPDDAKVMINIGTTLYRLKRYKEAAAAFERAAQTQDPILKQHALYDLGNSQFREQAFEEAVKSYEQAVSADPNDIDARENLAVARAALAQQPQKKDPKDQDPNQKPSGDPNNEPNKNKNQSSGPTDKSSESDDKGEATPPSDTEDTQRGGEKKNEQEKETEESKDKKAPAANKSEDDKTPAADRKDKTAKADEEAPTTMSRERAEQLLNKLGETKTVRPQAQKARPPTGGKTW